MVIDTDYTGSCKFNYHTITTITAPLMVFESTSTFTIREYINTYTASSIYLLYLPDVTLCQKASSIYLLYLPDVTLCQKASSIYLLYLPDVILCQKASSIYLLYLPDATLCQKRQVVCISGFTPFKFTAMI